MYIPFMWRSLLQDILHHGTEAAPRGKRVRELLQRTTVVDMTRPVLTVPSRGLNYKFMAAEAYWILTGDNKVETIAPYNKNIAQFSDDGERFFGAYGPKIIEQLPYIVAKLSEDPDTRQAGLTIWRENPPATKDVPCTIAIFFTRRQMRIHCHVFMRSSDAWLGVPYDVFNFSMLTHLVCGHLNYDRASNDIFEPGLLYLTAANQHLYEPNWEAAGKCAVASDVSMQAPTPKLLYNDKRGLIDYLRELRDSSPGSPLRWWEQST